MLDSNVSGELTIAASEYVKEGEYWIKKLSGTPGKTTFFYDRFPTQETGEGSLQTVKLELPGELYSKLMWIARGYDHTLHMILVTGIVILLHKYTGQRDIIVGAPIYKQDVEGEFVNTVLALRSYVEESMTFKELLLQVRQTILEANENQNYPIETLLYRLNIPFSGGDFPLFDVIVLLEGIHDKKYIEHTLKPNMVFSFRKLEGALAGVVEFNSRLYDPSSVKRIVAHFTALLQEALFFVDMPISDINILSAEEQKQQLFDFNRTRNDYPADKTIHQLIAEQVARTPGDAAVIVSEENGLTLTYSQLEEKASQLADYLSRGRGIKPGELVGILMDSSPELVVAILGILQAGAAYVPMDPVLPQERIKQIIKDANLGVIISLKRQIRLLNRLQWECASFDTFLCMDSRDIHAEEEVEKSELMDEKLWDYVAEIAVDEVTGGGWNSSYTGEPFSKEEMAEYGENILAKLTPLLRKDSRVLEIGCASGISMYRIAPLVGIYHGTDLSAKMIERNRERVAKEGHTNIVLCQLPAHLIDTVGDRNYDLVILNSVIQSFHGHNYLGKVIGKAVDLLAPQGHLFIGDVMDHDLKGALIRDLVAFRQVNNNKTIQTKTDFSTELFVSRRFFEDLRVDIPEISRVEFSRKICTIQNELTRYRYDALITIDKAGKAAGNNGKKRKYQEDARAFWGCGTAKVASGVTSCHPAYVIYTSGTTGTPRGVVITHRSLVNYATWAVNIYTAGKPVALPLYSSISFDLTVTSLYLPLLTGGSIAVYGSEKHSFPMERIIKEGRVDIVKATPSHLKLLQNEIIDNNSRLKRFILGGEELERLLAQTIYLGFSRRVEIYNEYGPTEATVGCMIYKFNYEQDRGRSVSIGLPVDNVRIYILDAVLNPVPINGVGEIFIGGDALARGYLNHVDATVEKFREDETGSTGERRLYRTGDLARRLLAGNIEFLGRVDEQVKIRGYRLELQEIENRLRSHGDVREAVVVAVTREVGGGDNRIGAEEQDKILCAYIVPDNDREVEVAELIDYLSVHLPDYMIPSYFVPVDRIPLTPNGKLDKRALPEPTIASSHDTYAAPGNKIQLKLVEIWSTVLGIDRSTISIDANFFELGGHSLRATIVIAQIHKVFNVKVPLAEIFKHPFIRELADYIEEMAEDVHSRIEPVEKKDYYILSSAQKRLYVLQQMDLDDMGYNEPKLMVLEGRLDKESFEDTFQKLIKRHESLRTSFHLVKDEPVQRIPDAVDFEIEYFDTEDVKHSPACMGGPMGSPSPGRMALDIIKAFMRPFGLTRAPLFRVGLIKEEDEKYILMFDMHHIITDGTSMGIVAREFMNLYRGEELPPLHIQYKDFSEWQNRETVRESLKKQEVYWLGEFKGEIPVLNLPTDYTRPAVKSFEGKPMRFSLDIEAAGALRELARRQEATMYMVLLTIFNILLSKISGSEDIVVGTVTAGRRHADLQPVIGMFVNTLAMRNYPRGSRTFNEFLGEVKERTLEAFENQDYPFEDLVERLAVPRDTSRNPLFEALFVLQNMEIPTIEIPQLKLLPYNRENNVSKFDIVLHAQEFGQRLMFSLEYSTRLFKIETIERFVGYLKEIVSSVIEMPEEKLEELDLISEKEKRQILADFNDTKAEYPKEKVIHQLYEEQVGKKPDSIGVGSMGPGERPQHLTYRELSHKSNQLAHWLRAQGVEPNAVVGILAGRSVEMIIALLGILKAGGAYLPIDPDYPQERVQYMLQDSQADILLRQSGLIGGDIFDGISIELDDLFSCPEVSEEVENTGKPADLAYMMYTSGSTARPKGVMVGHRNVIRLVVNTNYVALTGETRILQTGAPVFDATTFEVWGALLNGGGLYLVENEVMLSAGRLGQAMVRNKINTLWLTSPLFNQLCRQDCEIFSCLDYLLVGGDVLSPRWINRVRSKDKNLKVINGYGPTENTTFSTTFLVDRDYEAAIPIGRPIHNSTALILDKDDRLQPIGIPGQLCVGGDGVSRGYLNSPELTAEKFVDLAAKTREETRSSKNQPLNPESQILYRTGDIARWLKDGNIEFLGRMDNQVKIRGFRIEPGEIENQLVKHDGVREAVVIDCKDEKGETHLYAYVVPSSSNSAALNISGLRAHLLQELPGYMVPSYFIRVGEIPLTTNGKVDRGALLSSKGAVMELATDYAPLKNKMERQLIGVWKEVLDRGKIGRNDNFFDLGGNSLSVVSVVHKLKDLYGMKLSVAAMFQYPTVGSLSQYLAGEGRIQKPTGPGSEARRAAKTSRQKQEFRRRRR